MRFCWRSAGPERAVVMRAGGGSEAETSKSNHVEGVWEEGLAVQLPD